MSCPCAAALTAGIVCVGVKGGTFDDNEGTVSAIKSLWDLAENMLLAVLCLVCVQGSC